MSGGWIKLEKDLLTDPRLLRIATALAKDYQYDDAVKSDAPAQICNGRPLPGVILILGALTYLWMIADSHIGDDDVLPLGIDEINHILGMQNLAELIPENWLQIIDTHHVKLPGYQAHNGPIAKERAQNQKRVAAHRAKSNAKPLQTGNGRPLPEKSKSKTREETPLPPIVGLNADAWAEWVTYRIKIRKPLKAVSFPAAQREMASHGAAQAAVVEYSIAHGYQGLFAPHAANGATNGGAPPNRDAATWAEARSLAHDIGFREPYPLESAGSYLTAARYARNTPPPRDVMKRIEGMR